MFEKCDWTKYLINILKHNFKVTTIYGNLQSKSPYSVRIQKNRQPEILEIFGNFSRSYFFQDCSSFDEMVFGVPQCNISRSLLFNVF